MAINKNHLFEDIDGVKCAIVESGVNAERKNFLKSLLELNGFTVVVAIEAEKKIAPVTPPPAQTTEPVNDTSNPTAHPIPTPPPAPVIETYKIGVTDVTFNSINAIYGRLLKTANGRIVTMAYWLQKEVVSNDQVPYFDAK